MRKYSISPAVAEDLPLLAAIEKRAAARFPAGSIPDYLFGQSVPMDVLKQAMTSGGLFCARLDGLPVGFALFQVFENLAYLAELDVDPEHMGRGLGSALIEKCAEHARALDFSKLYLTTFSNFDWNEPFYARRGFRTLNAKDMPAQIKKTLVEQAESGMQNRVGMVRRLEQNPAKP